MKVIDNKADAWTQCIECPDCKSSIEIHATDVSYQSLGSFDGPYESYYSARCGACKTSISLPAKTLPEFVKAKAVKL